jgi:hypothetical protein
LPARFCQILSKPTLRQPQDLPKSHVFRPILSFIRAFGFFLPPIKII